MNKVALLGLAGALMAVMAACGGVDSPEIEQGSSVDPARKYVMDGQEISDAKRQELEVTHRNVYYYPVASGESDLSVLVFVERSRLEAHLGSIVKPQFCTGKSTTTVYDLENYNQSGASETFDVNDDESDLSNNTKPGGGTTWHKDISSIKSGSCITTILYKDLNFQGSSWVFTGQNEKTLGSFNNQVESIELF